MTDQAPERLENLHPEVDLEGLWVYRVTRDAPEADAGWRGILAPSFGDPLPGSYIFDHAPKVKEGHFTALYRGHVASFRLGADGRLGLVGYTYPFSDVPADAFEEPLHGDFWLVLAHCQLELALKSSVRRDPSSPAW